MPGLALIATYGLEIAEVGGTLARHADSGDEVNAVVVIAHRDNRSAITSAATLLGVAEVTFLDGEIGTLGGVEGEAARDRLVAWLRRVQPSITLMPEPEHALVDLDPERRPVTTLALEACALSGRDWREDELGQLHEVDNLYFYATHRPTCAVDITASLHRKLNALGPLGYQTDYTAEVLRRRMGATGWSALSGLASAHLAAGGDNPSDKGESAGGPTVLAALELAHALHHGAGGHGRAPFVEVFRHAGLVPLDRLI